MPNRFYAAGELRAARVRDLFAAIADRYDLINDLQSFGWHRYWKRRLVKLAQLKRAERALDLCCGTGDVALALAKTGGMVIGLDFSLPMLVLAKKRARRFKMEFRDPERFGEKPGAGTTSLHDGKRPHSTEEIRRRMSWALLQGDALRLPFPDGQFDVVSISYGLRNLENLPAGLNEIWRVLKPGGRLLALDFGKPDNAAWRKLYFAYLRWCVPWFGRLFCGDAETHAYILESLAQYPAQRGVSDLMRQMNYTDVRVINFLGGIMSINVGVKSPGLGGNESGGD